VEYRAQRELRRYPLPNPHDPALSGSRRLTKARPSAALIGR
jgi:hypothetical protein